MSDDKLTSTTRTIQDILRVVASSCTDDMTYSETSAVHLECVKIMRKHEKLVAERVRDACLQILLNAECNLVRECGGRPSANKRRKAAAINALTAANAAMQNMNIGSVLEAHGCAEAKTMGAQSWGRRPT